MSKEIMQQALTVLKAWDALIKYQYGGSSEAMTAMQNVAWRTLDTIEGLETALAQSEQEPEQEPVAHLWECIGRWSAYLASNGEKANLSPPEWLVDAVKAATAQPEQEPDAWRNAAIRLGEDLHSVGPNGYYDMTAKQWLDWALSVVNIAHPEQEHIECGYDETVGMCTNNPCCEQAQPEQEPVCDKDPFYCWSIRCQVGKVCKHTAPSRKEWVGLTEGELIDIKDCNRGFWTNAAKIEQLLKDKNT